MMSAFVLRLSSVAVKHLAQLRARAQSAQHKTHRMLSDIFDPATNNAGKIAEGMWAEHLKAQRRQHRRVALADCALALTLGNHLAQHAMKRIVELLVEHRPTAGHLGRRAQIEQCGLALAAVILHQYQRAQLQQRVTLGLSSFLEAVVRIGAGSVADRREQVLFARKTAIDRANAYTGAPG